MNADHGSRFHSLAARGCATGSKKEITHQLLLGGDKRGSRSRLSGNTMTPSIGYMETCEGAQPMERPACGIRRAAFRADISRVTTAQFGPIATVSIRSNDVGCCRPGGTGAFAIRGQDMKPGKPSCSPYRHARLTRSAAVKERRLQTIVPARICVAAANSAGARNDSLTDCRKRTK